MSANEPIWVRVADALHFVDDLAQIADRFETGYGPALSGATTEAARERAMDALQRYLASSATRRKPWRLSPADAERAAKALADLV
jgi:hypothetical protein